MRSPMQIWRHSLGVVLFCALFLAGRLMATGSHRWAGVLTRHGASAGRISRFFLLSGKFFVLVAVVGGFVEAVAVMVLASGWLIDFLGDVVAAFGFAD
jgi:hypothetical protein